MERVKGIGGVFFKSRDPESLLGWYREHLGIEHAHGCAVFPWRRAEDPQRKGSTVWSPFSKDTEYFAPSEASFMINYRVDDLDAMLAQLRAAGVTVDDRIEESEFGPFGWAMDPDGNRLELWEPPASEDAGG